MSFQKDFQNFQTILKMILNKLNRVWLINLKKKNQVKNEFQ